MRRRKRPNFSACAEKERLFSNVFCCFSDVIGSFWNEKNSFWFAKSSILLKWNSFLRKLEVFKNRTSSVTRNKIGFVPRYWRREEKVGKNFCTVQKEHLPQRIIIPSVFFNMIRVSMVAFLDSATEPRWISFDNFVAHA